MRIDEGQREECRVSHMIFADDCHLCAAARGEIRKINEDTTEELGKRGLDWKEDQMELMAWGFEEEVDGVLFDKEGRTNKVKEVKAPQATGTMITQEADSMSAKRFRMRKADEASWMEMKYYKNTRIADERKH